MLINFLFLIILNIFIKDSYECSCDGVEIQLEDQNHCFEIIRDSRESWVDADIKCAEIGGYMAHIDNASLYNQLEDYIINNYEKPLMTGATVANVELDLVALMCPSNTFYSLLDNSFVESFFNGTPGNNERCTFITDDKSDKLHYMPCDTSADILCDRPMERINYCNIMMNCTTTTTLSTSTTSITTTTFSTSTKLSTTKPIALNTTTLKPGTTTVNVPTMTTTEPNTATTVTTIKPPDNTVPPPNNNNNQCGKNGYTRVFGWCVPWWCWLVFGLLLFGLLLCLLSWCCHFCNSACLCSHKKQKIYPPEMVKTEPMFNYPSETVACQTDSFLLPKGETVYVPVPKTPPPSEEKVIIKEVEKEKPIHTHTVYHTKEIIHDRPNQNLYDVTLYENAFNKQTVVIPPTVQQPEPIPTVFLPPAAVNFDNDGINNNSLPVFKEEEILPIGDAFNSNKSIVPVVPVNLSKKRRGRPISPLKQNRPPIGGLHPKKLNNPIADRPASREFPKRPSSAESYREFPKPPPDSPVLKQRSITPPESVRPIRRNTPLTRRPEKFPQNPPNNQTDSLLSTTKHPIDSSVTMPFVQEKTNPKEHKKKSIRTRSPESHSRPPPMAPSPKPKRVSPLHDSPTKLSSSPRKFRSSSPQLSTQSLNAPFSKPTNSRRRSPLPGFEEPANNRGGKNATIRDATGRLGEAQYGRPDGWKPWSKSPQPFSNHPGFLDNDN